jgi:hypothetical protein
MARHPDYKITDTIGGILHYIDVFGRKQTDHTKHLFTTSFFRMKGADPEQFRQKYMTNFTTLVKDIGKLFKWFKLRVYCDETIFADLEHFLDLPYVELFRYHVPKLYDAENKVHYSHIGTMMRFLPLFNLPNHTAEIVVNLDIDNSLHATRNTIMRCIKERKNFCYRTRYCYNVIARMYKYFEYEYPIIASFIFINTRLLKLSPGILGEFYNKCILRDDPRYTEYLEHLSASQESKIGKYDYGVDEYFMNTYLLRYFYKTRTPYYVFINSPDANNMLSGYIPYLRTLQLSGKLNHQAVAEFTDLFAKTVGATLPEATPENTIERLDTLREKLAPFGTVQPVKDPLAKQALAKFMSTQGPSAHIVPNLQRCIFNNFSFDKSADMIKRITPSIQKSKKSSAGRTGKKLTQKRAPRK